MKQYLKKIEVRWADLDPNFHMLHSKYYDLGAYSRITFLVEHGLTAAFMQQHNIGPIVFREECIFKKEISFGDNVSINLRLKKTTDDGSRWTMVHRIFKNENILAAEMTCDGAWIDTKLRKLAIPPAEIMKVFDEFPKTEDFTRYTKDAVKT